ncbi:MAG: DNA adenine methylase [Anaerolineales bacterium]|nr:DNA adenine methylase [Anaerolineales bacterium]
MSAPFAFFESDILENLVYTLSVGIYGKHNTLNTLRMQTTIVKPFIKWAGGKRGLVPEIRRLLPAKYGRYLEPFLGGGAVALALNSRPMYLNDINEELINAYLVIRNNLEQLILILDGHQSAHSESYFYAIRDVEPALLTSIERAGRFIYLNKTAFNGLYRVNRRGEFNVPFGNYKNPILYERENLEALSSFLIGVYLSCQDYAEFLELHAQVDDVIYLDPPYQPIGKYSDFKRYTKNQFGEQDQRKLARIFDKLANLGAYPILSNSYSELVLELYRHHVITVVDSNRAINKNAAGRGPVREVIVTPRS